MTKAEREEIERRRRRRRERVMYRTSGYGWGPYPGWTAQDALNPGQFGSVETPSGDMTTTGGGEGGDSSGGSAGTA